ncbi:MAG: Lrp/AsnC family transcriptional regulator [Paracoccaceae bacterium]
MDPTDCQLLKELQKNAQLTSQQLGDILNLSPSQAGRRRQRLEADGYIESYTARLCPVRMGLNVQAFVQVQMATHEPAQVAEFTRKVGILPEITSAWTLTGDADYLLRVYCEDLTALNRLIHDIILPMPSVARVQSQIVMNQLKADAPLPT